MNDTSERRDRAGAAHMQEDAEDRRAALRQAVALFDAALDAHKMAGPLLDVADAMYAWLRTRPSLKPVRLVLTHGDIEQQPSH